MPKVNDDTLLGWPEYQRGQVALVFATLFAAPAALACDRGMEQLCYRDASQANRLYRHQLDVYRPPGGRAPDKFQPDPVRSPILKAARLMENAAGAVRPAEPLSDGRPVGLVTFDGRR